jgi:hypothetical protein
VLPQRFSPREAEALAAAADDASSPLASAVAVALREHRMATGQAEAVAELRAAGRPYLSIPQIVQAQPDALALIERIGAALGPLLEQAQPVRVAAP